MKRALGKHKWFSIFNQSMLAGILICAPARDCDGLVEGQALCFGARWVQVPHQLPCTSSLVNRSNIVSLRFMTKLLVSWEGRGGRVCVCKPRSSSGGVCECKPWGVWGV